MASASSPKTGNAYRRPRAVGRSTTSDADRSAGTNTSRISMSWLPVPRRPIASHVSWISTSSAWASIKRGTGGSSPSTKQPPISQSEWVQPLANGQRPETLKPSSTRVARPRGANTPPAIARGSA